MLLRFSGSNFRSIKDRQEVSFIASSYSEHAESLVAVEGISHKVLPVAAIYGANASGKSNVTMILQFIVQCIAFSQTDWKQRPGIPRRYFKLDPACAHAVSAFDVDVVVDGIRYHYGFECTSIRFEREWLYYYPLGKKRVLFERSGKERVKFARDVRRDSAAIWRNTRDNSLIISTALSFQNEMLTRVARALVMNTMGCGAGDGPAYTIGWAAVGACVSAISDLIREADTGIDHVSLDETNVERKAGETQGLSAVEMAVIYHPDKDLSKTMERASEVEGKEYAVGFHHRDINGDVLRFEFDEESRGTLRLFELAGPIQRALRAGSVVLVDEIEASLHPRLSRSLVQLFTDRKTNPKGAQLLFTTHDTSLLDTSLLRRDEIWFTEKGRDGATVLYPLSDIRVREKDNLAKGYLEGRFGAIPFVGDPAKLAGACE